MSQQQPTILTQIEMPSRATLLRRALPVSLSILHFLISVFAIHSKSDVICKEKKNEVTMEKQEEHTVKSDWQKHSGL